MEVSAAAAASSGRVAGNGYTDHDVHLIGSVASNLVDTFFGPFANGLLAVGRPYLLQILHAALDRFKINGISSTGYSPPSLNSETMVARALLTYVALAIAFLLSRRIGGGWTGCLLLLGGHKYTQVMAIGNRDSMAGLRDAAFWELGVAWISFCYTVAAPECSGSAQEWIVFTLAALQVMCARDVLIDEGQVYLVNDEPLATQSTLWMGLCSMCYFMPGWFSIALFLATWLVVLLANNDASQDHRRAALGLDRGEEEAAQMPQCVKDLAMLLAPIARELRDCKGVILFNASFSIPWVGFLAAYTSRSYIGFLLCVAITFLLFYASKSPEPFLKSNCAPPLVICSAIAALIVLPSRPLLVVALFAAVVFFAHFALTRTPTHHYASLEDYLDDGLHALRRNVDVEHTLKHVMSFRAWYVSFLGLGTLGYMEILPPDLHGFALCALLLVFSYVCVFK